ncbi:hypothetical protein COCVIDRAFT_95626, partial [Bipolaris victoriae FI3]
HLIPKYMGNHKIFQPRPRSHQLTLGGKRLRPGISSAKQMFFMAYITSWLNDDVTR